MGLERCGHFCPECDDDVSYPALVAERDRLRAALQQIVAGKIQADHDHPIGYAWGMAGRFINIARAALSESEAKDG